MMLRIFITTLLSIFSWQFAIADEMEKLHQLQCQNGMRKVSPFKELPKLDQEVIEKTGEYSKKLFDKAGVDTKRMEGSFSDRIRGIFLGIPTTIKSIEHQGITFRHYVKKIEHLETIVTKSKLRVGSTPYLDAHSDYYRINYPDLRGIFFTDINTAGEDVGVNSSYYIDFQLYPQTSAVELEKSIYMVPTEVHSYELKQYDWNPVPDAENAQFDVYELPIQISEIGYIP